MTRWIDLDGAVNVRDLGGLPTADGRTTRFGRVLRSDNLQDLTSGDVRRLTGDLGLRHVIDLRSGPEVELEGPGPLTRTGDVHIHHLSLFAEGGRYTDVEADLAPDVDKILPWQNRRDLDRPEPQRNIVHYLGYLADRPDSVVAALRVIAQGTSIVHCAAGKDRTGVVVAFALDVAEVRREAIVADYAATGQRLDRVLARLRASRTYAADLNSRPADSHMPHAETMDKFLATVDEQHGGPLGWLADHGWTHADTTALRTALLGNVAGSH